MLFVGPVGVVNVALDPLGLLEVEEAVSRGEGGSDAGEVVDCVDVKVGEVELVVAGYLAVDGDLGGVSGGEVWVDRLVGVESAVERPADCEAGNDVVVGAEGVP